MKRLKHFIFIFILIISSNSFADLSSSFPEGNYSTKDLEHCSEGKLIRGKDSIRIGENVYFRDIDAGEQKVEESDSPKCTRLSKATFKENVVTLEESVECTKPKTISKYRSTLESVEKGNKIIFTSSDLNNPKNEVRCVFEKNHNHSN